MCQELVPDFVGISCLLCRTLLTCVIISVGYRDDAGLPFSATNCSLGCEGSNERQKRM
jgi:hypothetical protein